MIERCESCKEQIVVVNGSKKHRYNLSVFCPNGKTLIPIGQRSDKPHEKYDYPYIAEAEMEADADADADAKVDVKAKSESEKEAEANEETEEDMKKQDAKPSKGKGEDQGKPSPPSDPQDGEDKSDSQQPPPPTSDDWALPAAQEINRLWEERIQNRDYKPTDEELAQRLLQHSKGKVNYQPFVPLSPPTTTRPLSKKLYDIRVRRDTVLMCTDFCFNCNEPIFNGAHAVEGIRLCTPGSALSGGSPPTNVERGKPYMYRPWLALGDRYSPIDHKPCPNCGDSLYTDIGRRGPTYHVSTGNIGCKE